MNDLSPIPIPSAQRWHNFRLRWLPALMFGAAVVAIASLWNRHVEAPSLVGQAEGRVAAVSSHLPGVLTELTVKRFQMVKAGEVIGRVIVASPEMKESSLAVIRAERDLLRANQEPIAALQRNALDYAQLRMDWMRQRADLASARVNMQLAEVEFHRAEELLKTKLYSQSEYDLAKATYDALQQQVVELTKLVADGETSFATMQPAGTPDIGHISNDAMSAAVAVEDANLRFAEAEASPVTLRAPMDGMVTMIYQNSGESVVAGLPIVTIAAAEPTRIVGYLRPPLVNDPVAGDQVEIRTRSRPRVTVSGQVLAVGPQLEPLPAIFCSLGRLDLSQQGLPVNISLPPDFKIRPGELVDITLQPRLD